MKKLLNLLLILILFFFSSGCKSKKTLIEEKKDIVTIKEDKTITHSNSFELDFSLEEIEIEIFEPQKQTTITDSKGNTRTFTNVKTITTKKENKALKQDSLFVSNDITDTFKDNTETIVEDEVISDANNYKWIFICLAIIIVVLFLWWLLYKKNSIFTFSQFLFYI